MDKDLLETASQTLEKLAYEYYAETCLIEKQVKEDILQYESLLKGARVLPTLNAIQYKVNYQNVKNGPLMKSRQAVIRLELFRKWQQFASYATRQYKTVLLKYENAARDYGLPKKVREITAQVTIQPIFVTYDDPCLTKPTQVYMSQDTAKDLANKQYKMNKRRKKKRSKNKKARDQQQRIMYESDLQPSAFGISVKGNLSNNAICEKWYKTVLDMYKDEFQDTTNFTQQLQNGSIGIVAKDNITMVYNVNGVRREENIPKNTNVATDAYIDRLLTKETNGLSCSKLETTRIKSKREATKKEIQEVLLKIKENLKQSDLRRRKLSMDARENAKKRSDKIMENAKLAAEKEMKEKRRKEEILKNSIRIPPAPKESPWNKTMEKVKVVAEKKKQLPVAIAEPVSEKTPVRAEPVSEKAPVRAEPVSEKAPVRAEPVKTKELPVASVMKAKKNDVSDTQKVAIAEPVVEQVEPVELEIIDSGGTSLGKSLGAYLLTSEFALNGSYFLEKEKPDSIEIDPSNIYKLSGNTTNVVRSGKSSGADEVIQRIDNLWNTNSKKEYIFKKNLITLSYNGVTYNIKGDNKALTKKFGRKFKPLTYIWLEPNANTESFTNEDGKRKRLQNRVQITYDSMSDGDIAEIEKAIDEYDDFLENSSTELQEYDSSSGVSDSKVSYDSLSDTSFDKVSYDSMSDQDEVKRSTYDSTSEGLSETEMDYSYDSSSGLDESDSNMS